MNAQKSVAVIAAMLITAAGMVGIANYSNAAAASQDTINASAAQAVTTLPTLTVRPSPAVLRELRKSVPPQPRATSASTYGQDAGMPYYSFAADQAGA